MQKLEDLATAYASIARPEIRRDHTAASCVASTWITIEVMRHFRVPARPVTVKVEICNASFVEFEKQHARRPFPGESNTTWIVGLGFQKEQGTIGTHLVAVLDDRILVDASIDQGNNPEHGIVLPGTIWTPISDAFLAGTRLSCDISGHRLIYIPTSTSIDLASLYDFNHNPETDSAVERIITKLEGLGFRPCTC